MEKPRFKSSRRRFLQGSTLAMGGLVLSTWLPPLIARSAAADAVAPGRLGEQSPTGYGAFVRVGHDGRVTVISPKIEMGQGTHTGIAMMVAEELEVSLDQVEVVDAPPNHKLYSDALLEFQGTGGSTATRVTWEPLRQAGATARILLIQAAALGWKVAPSQCHAENAVVFGPNGLRAGYGELVDAASALPVPTDVPLKKPEQFKLIGKPLQRVDTPNKVNGKTKFTIDLSVPDMQIASTLTCPVHGGTLRSVDDSAARKVPGVRDVVKLDNAVAVIASNYWACQQGLNALKIDWDLGANASINSAELEQALQDASSRDGVIAHKTGDISASLKSASSQFEAVYEQAFLSHSPLEPMTCVVHVRPDACDLWVGTQVPVFAQQTAAQVTGLAPETITVHNQLIGGAFGRRLDFDFITQAVAIAKQVSYPIKLIWSREEDMTHDMYRPHYVDRITAAFEGDKLLGWQHRIAGASVLARYAGSLPENGVDADAVEVAIEPLYAMDNLQVHYIREEPKAIPVSWWRGVGPLRSTYVLESFIDELAHNAKADPLEYRLKLMQGQPRAQAVLKMLAEKADWKTPLPAGQGRGLSVSAVFGSFVASMVELEMQGDKGVRIKRLVSVIDCGLVTNPTSVMAQIEGGTLFGLSAAFFNEILLEQGQVQQTNFHNYRQIRISEVPGVEVHLMPSLELPGGVGEAGTALIAPALVNALHAASGERVRRLPLTRAGYYIV
ncbi:xanthine dehydrogenase family protein molybdopterin-binding subunit [Pseudomonas segetis]|uniref:Isoquinoline 1-oxidoreductase, beta subunit n=1 Tax=Pseudomonas segetis TaxID=298908 RepID=A0A238ZTC2_9PSED|nr:molybdopterin cofactor-binding domain-containing protein [Pseudomonas segetis]SNR86168.1 isoquinoline 1-oxidoreductase, beta subunit [Pseudomonas segetis]